MDADNDCVSVAIQYSFDYATRTAKRIRKAAIPIIMEEMRMTKKQARKAYARLMGE